MLAVSKLVAAAAAAVVVVSAPLASARAAACSGVTFGSGFSGYACNSIGAAAGASTPYGGITFLNDNTLLIGTNADSGGGGIEAVTVIRGAGNHIVGFSSATSYASAPQIDGGLAFGPGGVLFYANNSDNQIGEIKPGGTSPTQVSPSSIYNPGGVVVVPAGFSGAESMKIVSFGSGNWYDATLTPDGGGLYDIAVALAASLTTNALPSLGPEGVVYVAGSNTGFGGNDSIIVSDWGDGDLLAYQVDANGDPEPGTLSTFASGLSYPEGAAIDPVTGDYLLSSFNGTYPLMVISGFEGPALPEPATITLFGAAVAALGFLRRRA